MCALREHLRSDKNQSAAFICPQSLSMCPIMEEGEWGARSKKVFDHDENGERIPVIDKKTGQQKVDRRNRKQWKAEIQSLQAEYDSISN